MENGKAEKMNQNQFKIQIAGLIIEICATSPRTFYLCRDYLSSGVPDIRVIVSDRDIRHELDESIRILKEVDWDKELNYTNNGRRIYVKNLNDNYLETVATFRKIVEEAINYNIVLIHGAVISLNKSQSYMFTAPSGTGKTTHIKIWKKKLDNTTIVNGDKPLIKFTDKEVIACGTPWCGKENLGMNTMVPLKAIVLMDRSEKNSIEEIPFGQAYPLLLQQTYFPNDVDKSKKILDLLSKLYGKVSFWRFQCNNFKDDCFDVAYNALVGKKP